MQILKLVFSLYLHLKITAFVQLMVFNLPANQCEAVDFEVKAQHSDYNNRKFLN